METKCIIVPEIDRFEWTYKTLRPIRDDEVLLRVEVTGMCRTDLKIIRHGHRDLVLPRIPGEEVVGVILDKGSKVSEFNIDDRVYVYPGVWCGKCPACTQGAENLCREMQIMGFHRDGGFAAQVIAPVRSLIAVPQGLDPDQAVLAEPLSCCLNALELGNVRQGDHVGIWGAGPAGLLLARAARAMGAGVVHIEPDTHRREFAQGVAACPEDERFDVCVVAVGNPVAYHESLMHLRPRGRLVVFSGLLLDEDHVGISLNQLHYYEQTLVGAYGCSYRHGVQALAWLADGTVPVADMISHRLPLSRLEEALQLVEQRKSTKILMYPE